MRRRTATLAKFLLVGGFLAFNGCGITSLQLQDFIGTTVIEVAAQTIVAVFATALAGAQAT